MTATDEIVKNAVESLRDKGFINYYGLQRFGSRADIPTFAIGKCLLQGNFEEVLIFIQIFQVFFSFKIISSLNLSSLLGR